MSKSKNYVSLIGIVGKDAELRKTNSGVPYVHISLATSTGGYKKRDGTDVPETTQWHRVLAWNGLAELAGNYVRKGMKIAVDGSLSYGTYKNQAWQDVNTTEIVASDIILMSQPQQQQACSAQAPQQQQVVNSWQQRNEQAQSYPQSPPAYVSPNLHDPYMPPNLDNNNDLPF